MPLTRNFPSATISLTACPTAVFRDEQAQNTSDGGSSATTWNVRTLNVVNYNNISGASLASNQFTLPAGTYYIHVSAPVSGAVGTHQLRLKNVTDTSYVYGQVGNCPASTTVYANLDCVVTIASAKVYEIDHYTTSAVASSGLGLAVNIATEVYTVVVIDQLNPVSVTATGITNNIDFLTNQVFGQ